MDSAGCSADCSAAGKNMVAADVKVRQAGMMRNGIEQGSIQGLGKAADQAICPSCETLLGFGCAAFHMDDGLSEFRNNIMNGLEHALR